MIAAHTVTPADGMKLRTVSHQGTHISLSQRRRLEVERSLLPRQYQPTDWEEVRRQIDSRMFVGPAAPLETRKEFQPDREAERFWRMAADFKRYGWAEIDEKGTPCVVDMVGPYEA